MEEDLEVWKIVEGLRYTKLKKNDEQTWVEQQKSHTNSLLLEITESCILWETQETRTGILRPGPRRSTSAATSNKTLKVKKKMRRRCLKEGRPYRPARLS